jgi:hypothetical protein
MHVIGYASSRELGNFLRIDFYTESILTQEFSPQNGVAADNDAHFGVNSPAVRNTSLCFPLCLCFPLSCQEVGCLVSLYFQLILKVFSHLVKSSEQVIAQMQFYYP